jgi:hypothetical protein
MKLNSNQIQYICEKVLRDLKEKDIIIFNSDENTVLKRMMAEFEKNLKDEENIEHEAKKLLAQHQGEVNNAGINQAKLFMMLKKEIAKKKGFIL